MEIGLPVNYLGAITFWLYILAALGLTILAIYTLASQRPPHDGAQVERRKLTLRFSALAVISFCTLSVNMLRVLIQSYTQWSKRLPSAYDRAHHGLLTRIWTWSITSTLFRDFGEAIVADQARYIWVLTALLATFSVCSYMGVEGRRRNIPQLWAFFALSQILPISFAQILFYIALIRQPPGDRPIRVRSLPSALVLVLYSFGLSVATQVAGTAMLMPLILVTRLLLLAQLLLTRTGTEEMKRTTASLMQYPSVVIAQLLIVRQVYLSLQEHSLMDIGTALTSHPAVSTLGCDLIISVISFAAWECSDPLMSGDVSSDSKEAS
ncbi:hypothetical protein LTS16_022485 [Friedmanniomyces endolithicus]|nr:hypothetical protein LTR57_023866 [Friedmanniomyces endolithicus]KAK0959847.1 hypothetical protein LTS01_021207 [Friedmanniomyces endolithicus]KAK1026264.1 hypothetical protein LTS16_022485 [Friedmanniomyces endolithicus]